MKTKQSKKENLMNFVAVAIVSAIVLGHPFNKRVETLKGVNCVLLCLNNSSKITKRVSP